MIEQAAQKIEASRRLLLRATDDARDVTFIRAYGNIGDELIYAGARQLLSHVRYQEKSVRRLDGVEGHTALLTGGGGWCNAFHDIPNYLRYVEERFERVVVLPSSFDTSVESVRRVLSETDALVFARESVSYEQIRGLCRAELAHDTAFFFDFGPYKRVGHGTLRGFRTDQEARTTSVPAGNDDISLTCESLDEWLWTIARHERILTDRAHVTIAGAMLGKEVHYGSSNYHKVPAIVEFALQGFPVFPLADIGETFEGAAEAVRGIAPVNSKIDWHNSIRLLTQELADVIPRGSTFIFADGEQIGGLPLDGRRMLPFLEREGQYWGLPADDETAIRELGRMRQAGADFFVLAWTAFWLTESYHGLGLHLQRFPRLYQNERLVVFDLREEDGGNVSP